MWSTSESTEEGGVVHVVVGVFSVHRCKVQAKGVRVAQGTACHREQSKGPN